MKEVDHQRVRENVEYVKGLTAQIEQRIVAESDDFFDTTREKEDLHITIRVACDFHKFLMDYAETPPQTEAEFVADTIRSGIDWAFLLAHSCRLFPDELAKWSFDRQDLSTFAKLRTVWLKRFEELCRPSASAGEMLASLLALVHLELVFMAQTFPSIVESH
jgi:hypothetical protein